MHSRQEWTNRRPAFSAARKNVHDIFIHHEGGGQRGNPVDKPAVLRQIEAYVIPKGYIAIDYNVMVFQDGSVWAGRGVQNEDGATINNNPTSVSICAVGNFELERAPDALIRGIQGAIFEIVVSGYSIPNPSIRAHKEVFGTACPGKNLIARFGELKNWNSATPPPVPEDYKGEPVFLIQVQGNAQIASCNGQTKHIFADPNEMETTQWCAAVAGVKNVMVVNKVTKKYWDGHKSV